MWTMPRRSACTRNSASPSRARGGRTRFAAASSSTPTRWRGCAAANLALQLVLAQAVEGAAVALGGSAAARLALGNRRLVYRVGACWGRRGREVLGDQARRLGRPAPLGKADHL